MKKMIAFILIFTLVFGMLTLSANAGTEKLGDKLKEALTFAEDDDVLELSVWFNYPKCPEPEFEQEDYGDSLEAVKRYVHDYRAYKRAYYTEHNQQLTEQILSQIDAEVVYASQYVPTLQIKVKAKDVETLSAFDFIGSIDLMEPAVLDPETTDPATSELYASRYVDLLKANDMQYYSYRYSELYYHRDENGEIDWALVQGQTGVAADAPVSMVIDQRVITYNYGAKNFEFSYGIFDVVKDEFVDLHDIKDMPEQYPDLTDILWRLKIGRPIGDADRDSELTILDATAIQRDLAEIEPINENFDRYDTRVFEAGYRFSDYDGDGELTILDATGIQRKLADLPV